MPATGDGATEEAAGAGAGAACGMARAITAAGAGAPSDRARRPLTVTRWGSDTG